MNKRIKRLRMSGMLAVVVVASTSLAAENPSPSLPFSIQVTEEKFENRPDYMGPRAPFVMDFPYCPIMIDGEYWVIFKNGARREVFRFKGTNIENAVRQPGTSVTFPAVCGGPYMLGGMWYDAAEKKLYAPMHCELGDKGYNGNVLREIHLASSTDKGLAWKYEGAIVTRDEPGQRRKGSDFSGLLWDGGDGDYFLYVDERGGYIYLFSTHDVWPKTESPGAAFGRHCVARCAIADKMAPGKWRRFYDGAWNQPGVGGKASYVNGYCVSYNSYLKRYLSLDWWSGIAFCDDLSKQEWSPSFRLGTHWGSDGVWGFWATNAEKNDVFHTGETMFVYSFWNDIPGRRFGITLNKNGGPGSQVGFNSPSNISGAPSPVTMDPGHCYGFTPLFESSDPIEARRTRRVGCASGEVKCSGNWSESANPAYYDGRAKQASESGASLEFTFKGKDIYWRAVKGPDLGKADVYLDGVLQATVDCWASLPLVYQFAFIKRGLSDEGPHTIKVTVKNEKNPRSTGTAIKHMLFEYSADTYRASDCFSSVAGKNQWHYQQRKGGALSNMTFKDPNWKGDDTCAIGYFHMTPGTGDAVREWVAPRAGVVRVEGRVSPDGKNAGAVNVSILHNAMEIWPMQTVKDKAVVHDMEVTVAQGDALHFIASKKDVAGGRVHWDPVATYTEPRKLRGL